MEYFTVQYTSSPNHQAVGQSWEAGHLSWGRTHRLNKTYVIVYKSLKLSSILKMWCILKITCASASSRKLAKVSKNKKIHI